ncbi:MAG TPA: biotin/lipoyl-binding protein [Anaerolineae bacterium]|nr:biotin/lipoyl-binding protein [Anaerolineae bacterium]MCB0214365.1 biotin/lipoyl-binding protein [Anaerolineae bacterium]MCB0226487.1 biotin/lipoyl-binding protein [Anaerolineae bacterium]MCB9106607.1 biotin/lipoyl-binding protein [Anaerolineales bacterium]HRV92614.1 biotin/lipoyl-binding protein [Anaerolineae bacterium]
MKKLRVTVNGTAYDVEVEVLADTDQSGSYGYESTTVLNPAPRPAVPSTAAPAPAMPAPAPAAPPAAAPSAGASSLTAPLPGVVKGVKVKEGDSVKKDAPVVILEAMKMETVINSPVDGVVSKVHVSVNQSVQQGEVLVEFS